MKSFRFNLNSWVMVKLTDKGYRRMADRHNELADLFPQIGARTVDQCREKADREGYSKFQAWDFMNIFGPVTGMGFDQCFETEIIIRESDLYPLASLPQTPNPKESAC